MTEAEWLTCNDPVPMLSFLRGKGRVRTLRLFAVACCRRAWDAYRLSEESPRMHPAVLAGEGFADGLAGKERLRFERSQIGGVGSFSAKAYLYGALAAVVNESPMDAAEGAATDAAYCLGLLRVEADRLELPGAKEVMLRAKESEFGVQACLLREVVGNPFRPVAIDPAWLTPEVLELAQSIYEERTFGRIPILADALESAGCDHAEILDHCRTAVDHVRGCWVIDLVLGKA